ncbi:MAG: hypothetical protein HY595_02525, partial [Candidatus Omnitrophica bacterium]|nr:hypothetical protein [Candidatus Omnitrophota bacterium]
MRFRRERWHAKLLDVLRHQPPEWRRQTGAALRDAAHRDELVIYSDPKTAHPVAIHALPLVLTRAQATYLQVLGHRIRRVVNRLLRTYLDDPALQDVLPFSEEERSWFASLAPQGIPEPMTVFERFDTNLAADEPEWARTLRILEFNAVGVGCLHFTPVANALIAEQVLPTLQAAFSELPLRPMTDPRLLLRRTLEDHAKAIGRSTCVVAFVERRETSPGGADEMLHVSRFLQTQGLQTVCVDPRELELRGGEIVHHDLTIDLLYRDFSLSEILSIEKHGGHAEAIKHAFLHNQVISGLTGEFDHKSLCELLSNPEFDRYFTPSQRRTNRTFIPWTRLIRERKTSDPNGHEVEVAAFIREHRERLVMKPNRLYGGQDVVIGRQASAPSWNDTLTKALAAPNTWVAQEAAPLPVVDFLDPEELTHVTHEFVTVGFIPSAHGVACVGRAAPEPIVNISRGGRLVPM